MMKCVQRRRRNKTMCLIDKSFGKVITGILRGCFSHLLMNTDYINIIHIK